MKKRTKKLLATLALACMVTASIGGLTACGEGGEDNALKVEFLEGYLDEISLGESIQIRDYIPQEILEYKKDGKKGYTFKMQFGDEVYDLTNRATFLPEYIGDWKMILTVGKKTVEIDFTVKGKTLAWADHIKPQIEFEVGGENGTLDFATTLDNMGIEVFSDCDYETFINSVLIGSTNPTRVSLKEETSYTFEKADIHIFEYKTVATDGQEISGNFWAIPKTTEAKEYIKKDADYPFRDWYGGTSCGRGYLKPDIATDGYYVDGISYQYTEDYDWAGLRANANLFKNYFNYGATALKFDIYNTDSIDHTYTVFHHLKKEALPEGSEGTLKAGEWTTITITKEMFAEAFAKTREDYLPIENDDKYTDWSQHGAYGFSRPSWATASNFAFTFAIHNSAYVKGTPSANISFNLDNVRVDTISGEEVKVRLLSEFNPDDMPEIPKVMTDFETNFSTEKGADNTTNKSNAYFLCGVSNGPSFTNDGTNPFSLNMDSTYVLDGTTSWEWKLKNNTAVNGLLGMSLSTDHRGDDGSHDSTWNIDSILDRENVASVSFKVFNTCKTDLYWGIASGRITTGTNVLRKNAWSTVIITKADLAKFDMSKIDIVYFSICSTDGAKMGAGLSVGSYFSLYFDELKINNVGDVVEPDDGGTPPPVVPQEGLEANFWSEKIDDKTVSGNESLVGICYSPFDVLTPEKNFDTKYVKEGDSSWRLRLNAAAGYYGGMVRFSVGVEGTQENNIDDIFAGGAESITFEIFTRTHSDGSAPLYYAFGNTRPNESTVEKEGLAMNDWTTITITKADYEAAVSGNKFYLNIFAKAELTSPYDLYFDNFQINMPQAE